MQQKADVTIENWLPLEPLILALKKSGFVVTPSTYVQFKDLAESYPVQNLRENNYALLGDLLCPIVTQNKDQQQRFKIVFENYLIFQRGIDFPKKSNKQKKVERFLAFVKTHKIKIIAVIVVVTIMSVYKLIGRPEKDKIEISNYRGDTLIQLNDSNEFNGKSFLPDSFPEADKFSFEWGFGDNSKPATLLNAKHTYTSTGNFQLSVHLKSKEYGIDTTVNTTLTVVMGIPRVQIQTRKDLSNLKQGDAATFTVKLTDSRKVITSTTWTVNDSVVSSLASPLTYLFNDTGFYVVKFTAIVDSLNAIATQHDDESFYVGDKTNAAQFIITPTGKVLQQSFHINRNWLISIFLLLVFLWGFFRVAANRLQETTMRLKELQKKIKDAIEAAIAARLKKVNVPYEYRSTQPPFEISFATQDHLVNYSPEFDKLVQSLRNRVHDESNVLRLSKTIAATVRRGGFIDLVYDPKSKPREYLILVDKQYDNSQQTKLFCNLANYYADGNVFSENFIFNINLEGIYRENDPAHTIELSDLKRKFPEHITVIISDGYGLLDETESLPHDSVLYQWQKTVILTPVPLPDWGYREKILQQKFLLLPVDVQGQRVLLDAIETLNFKADKQIPPDINSYSITYIDFSDAGETEEYLNTEEDGDLLFQWLCGVAVYPKIKWEIILAVGYALLSQYNKLHLLSFDSLLKLTRIPWLHEGKYTGYMRYNLLKKLKRENEFIARNAIIDLLNRSSAPKNSFAFEEWDIQKKTNEAILFASDQVKYAGYEVSFIAMKKLWSNKLITDLHLVQSLGEESISSYRIDSDSNAPGVEGATMAEFFTQDAESVNALEREQIKKEIELQHEDERIKLEAHKRKFTLVRNSTLSVLLFVFFSGAALLLFKDNVKTAGFNSYLHILIPENTLTTDITFTLSFDSCFVNSYLGNSPYKTYLIINNKDTFKPAPTTGAIRFTNITLDSLNSSAAIFFDSKKNIASPVFSLTTDSFTFTARNCVVPENTTVVSDTVFIQYSNNQDKETIYTIRKYLQQQGYTVLAPYWRSDFNSISEVRYSDASKKQKADSLAASLSGLVDIDTTVLNSNKNSDYPLELWINNSEITITNQCEEVDIAEVNKFEGMWRDNNNRVIRFYSQGNQIYYSTGDVKTYSTYYTVRVCKADSTYLRFITRAKYGYKVFFVNVINARLGSTGTTRPRMQMRLCDAVQAATEAEAEKITANQCPAVSTFNKASDMGMAQNQIVYDYDKKRYASFEQRKLDSIVRSLNNRANKVSLTPYIGLRGNNATSTSVAQKGAQQIKSYLLSKGAGRDQVQVNSGANVLPFNRDYILFKLYGDKLTDAPIKKPDEKTNSINPPATSNENQSNQTSQPPVKNNSIKQWQDEFNSIQKEFSDFKKDEKLREKLSNEYKTESNYKKNVLKRLEKLHSAITTLLSKSNSNDSDEREIKSLLNQIEKLKDDITKKNSTKIK